MSTEINTTTSMTPTDTARIGEAMSIVRSILDEAGMTYLETHDPTDCTKPHFCILLPDANGNATAIVNLFVSGRAENGSIHPINAAKILTRQRDGCFALGLHHSVTIVEAACFPFLSREKHNLTPLNQTSEFTLFKQELAATQREPHSMKARMETWTESLTSQLRERNPYGRQPSGISAADLLPILEEYYKSAVPRAGSKGEETVNRAILSLPDPTITFMHSFCTDSSNVCDQVLLIPGCGFVIIETKDWTEIQKMDGKRVTLDEHTVRANPSKQVLQYRSALIDEISRRCPSCSPDDAERMVKCICWFPQLPESAAITEHLCVPAIFAGEEKHPAALLAKLKGLFDSQDACRNAIYLDFRRMMEPQFQYALPVQANYSRLRIWEPDTLTPEAAVRICDEWSTGTKQVHFVQTEYELNLLRDALTAFFSSRSIRVGNDAPLALRFSADPLDPSSETMQALSHPKHITLFRMEVYLLPLGDYPPVEVINGKQITKGIKAELLRIQNRLLDEAQEDTDSGVFSYEQYRAEHSPTHRNTDITAGAGTGKTYQLTAMLAYLCFTCSGASVSELFRQVVLLTFTNSAAEEMAQRIKEMFQSFFVLTGNSAFRQCIAEVSHMTISTIDAYFKQIIAENPTPLGIGSDFTVTTSLYPYRQILYRHLSKAYAAHPIDHDLFDSSLRDAVLTVGEAILQKGADAAQCDFHFPFSQGYRELIVWLQTHLPEILADAQAEFAAYLREHNQLLLSDFTHAFRECVSSDSFNPGYYDVKHLFVDEFQDTSSEQIAALKLLQKKLGFRLVVVGDSKQSIYGFRNASPRAFEEVKSSGNWDSHSLTINRRATNDLMALTNEACKEIYRITGAQLEAFAPEQAHLKGVRNEPSQMAVNPIDEATNPKALPVFVRQLHQLWEQNPSMFEDAVILVRSNSLVQSVTRAVNQEGFVQAEAVSDHDSGDFYTQPAVLDLYFLLAALAHPMQPEYLFALLRTSFFRVGARKPASANPDAEHAMQTLRQSTKPLMQHLYSLHQGNACSMDDLLREFQTTAPQEFHAVMDAVTSCQNLRSEVQYSPFYPDSLGEDKYTALTGILNDSLAHYGTREPYLESWDALCRAVSNRGGGVSLLKLIHDLVALTQPWEGYPAAEKERYIANYELLFEEIAAEYSHRQLTLDKLYDSLRRKILTHQKKDAAAASLQQTAVPCMTIHKAKGRQWKNVFLFAGNTSSYTGNSRCTVRRTEHGRYSVQMQLRLKRIGEEEPFTLTSPGYSADTDANEEWRVLYVALTRAKSNLHISYLHHKDTSRNPWNPVLEHLHSFLNQKEDTSWKAS